MKRKQFAVLVVMVVMLFSAGLSFADDITLENGNQVNTSQTVTANPTSTSSVSGITAGATGGNVGMENVGNSLIKDSGNSSIDRSGNSTIRGSGNSNVDVRIDEARQFLPASVGGVTLQLIAPADPNAQHSVAQGNVREFGYFNQESYDTMINFLNEAHEIDSNTRTWSDLKEQLVIQPRIDRFRKDQQNKQWPLSNEERMIIVGSKYVEGMTINPAYVFGQIVVRDKKPVENPVENIYLGVALYPYAKKVGANVIMKEDAYFRAKTTSGGWGAQVGGAFSTIVNCLTGWAGGLNAGFSSSSASLEITGGERYVLLYIPELTVTTPTVKIEKSTPAPAPVATCDPDQILWDIQDIETKIRNCKFWSRDNLEYRARAAYLYAKYYICTGKLNKKLLAKAIKHAELAQTNYDEVHKEPINERIVSLIGWDEKGAVELLGVVYWNQAAAIRETKGRGKEIKHAQKKGLERMPVDIEETIEIDIN